MRLPACLIALALVAAACTTSSVPLAEVNGWQEVAAPAAGARILALAPFQGRLVALGSVPGPDGRAPAAWTTDGHGWRPVELRPVSGYGKQAELTRYAVLRDRILVWGTAFGGAHSNPRPTSWAGDADRLTEYEQGMETFGGPHAVGQYDEAGVGGTGLVVGQWDEERGGYGAAVWTSADGVTWTRHTDPALSGGSDAQTSAEGVAAQGDAFLVVGNSIGDRMKAAAWSSPDGRRFRPLPVPDGDGAEGIKVGCAGDECAIVGARNSSTRQALCWPVRGSVIGKPTRGPAGDTLDVLQVLPARGQTSVVLRVDGSARLFTLHGCEGWQADQLPVATRDAQLGVLPNGTELLATDNRVWTR